MKTSLIYILLLSSLYITKAIAVESTFHGLLDIRATTTSSLDSYTSGGWGKFALNDGQALSLSQAGAVLTLAWDNGLSTHLVANAYKNNDDFSVGVTEAYVKYSGLPNESGYRFQSRLGIFYPKISLENNAYAWASKNTLNSSSLNTWIGEEIRVLGSEISFTRLGKVTKSPFDLSFHLSTFVNNDPAGALLSWHGWTISNRQTLWTEKVPITNFQARREGNVLEDQASSSDPFLEVDDRVGAHIRAEIKFHRKGILSTGYYNNNAKPYIIDNGQYGWKTRFYHIDLTWRLPKGIILTSQFLSGDTLMQSPERENMVNNKYNNGYIALSKRFDLHRLTSRIEAFNVKDNDHTLGDNNTENGKAFTINYSYRLSKPWFLSAEYTWIDSHRPARNYTNHPVNLIEKQLTFAARYFY